MKRSSLGIRLLISCLLFLATISAEAQIYLNEGFEGAAHFVDRNWPVKNAVDPATVPLQMGINLRLGAEESSPQKVLINASSANIDSSRAFVGAKSLRISGGNKLNVVPGQFPNRVGGWFRVWQFAVSTDSASAALPGGTKIGHFRIDYSNDSTVDLTPDVSIVLQATANGSGGVDLFCANSGQMLSTLTGASDNWLLITVIAMSRLAAGSLGDNYSKWAAYDPIAEMYKGPQPDYYYPLFYTGIQIYADSASAPTVSTMLGRSDHLGMGWANEDSAAENRKYNTAEIGWEFAAENGGTLYLDNLHWSTGDFYGEDIGIFKEAASRMQQFSIAACGKKRIRN